MKTIKTILAILLLLLILFSSLLIFIWLVGNIINMITFQVFDFGSCQFIAVLLYMGLLTYILEKY